MSERLGLVETQLLKMMQHEGRPGRCFKRSESNVFFKSAHRSERRKYRQKEEEEKEEEEEEG